MEKNRYLIGMFIAGSMSCGALFAETIPSAYNLIAAAHNVPPAVLYAVASQESNYKLRSGRYRPWPWTLNVAGQGYYYRTRQAACTALQVALKANSPKRVDVGIAQVNIGWNPNAFSSPCAGLDPYTNLNVAAKILRGHFLSSGDWAVSTGLYHHPAGGPTAAKYQRSVELRMADISPAYYSVRNEALK